MNYRANTDKLKALFKLNYAKKRDARIRVGAANMRHLTSDTPYQAED